MKIYISHINESWIIDRIKKEWIEHNKNTYSQYYYFSDLVWLIAPWSISEKKIKKYKNKKIIYSQYHFENFSEDDVEIKYLKKIDRYIDAYHVISKKTQNELATITKKPIYYLPLWVNQDIWFEISDKNYLRKKYKFTNEDFLVGSFQRDTEGHDLKSPKLVKGPDIFIKLVKILNKRNKNLKVVLAGKRREYVINELEKLSIPYFYFEMANFETTNELYNLLDLYLITSRLEGGPQALVECGLTKTPLLSTDVGIADEILDKNSIYDYKNLDSFITSKTNVDYAFKKSSMLTIPSGMIGYNKMFKEVYEN